MIYLDKFDNRVMKVSIFQNEKIAKWWNHSDTSSLNKSYLPQVMVSYTGQTGLKPSKDQASGFKISLENEY